MTQKTLIDYHLSNFKSNHPESNIVEEDDHFVVSNVWKDNNIKLVFGIDDKTSIALVNNLLINSKFDGIIFISEKRIEFVYGFFDESELNANNSHLKRKFDFVFEDMTFKAHFGSPSEEFWKFSKIFKREPKSYAEAMNQMAPFCDFGKDDLPEKNQKYFEKRLPVNFHLEGVEFHKTAELETIFRNLNAISHYYDRTAPIIAIRNENDQNEERHKEVSLIEDNFPSIISLKRIDDIALRLLETARGSSTRMSFLYYYQVIEYLSHTYTDEVVKKKLTKLLRNPSIVSCSDQKISEIFNTVIDLNHNDDVKMRNIVESYIEPETIWREIELNIDFFSKPVVFDGGFELKAMISETTDKSSWSSMWHPKLIDSLTKIRNCIVHARERRENKVILPSSENNLKLAYFNNLIARIAEIIAIKHG